MNHAEPAAYLAAVTEAMRKHWPGNRAVNIVCHGHSVPAGYFATPMVDTLNAYPHLLLAALKHRFPFAVCNVIVTAIGGENSESGAKRFEKEVLCHRPDVVTLDYGLNDRGPGLERGAAAWRSMIEAALSADVKVILLTPTADKTQNPAYQGADKVLLEQHAAQIRQLAETYGVGLVDSLAAFQHYMVTGHLTDLLSWSNHPNRAGHELVAKELLRWFPAA
jgi:acyl-CoA thioesterase-1